MDTKPTINNFIVVILPSVLTVFIIFFLVMPKVRQSQEKITESEINNFEECIAAGNPVMESYPRQCAVSQGKTFTEAVGNMLEEENEKTGIANPASVNCIENSGTLEMRNNKNGEYGVCLFEDNRQCEEWAFLRGQCPVGGMKVTGYENDAEIYCAITGGQVENVGEIPMCKRTDGRLCNVQSNFDGECPDPNDPNPNAGNDRAQ